MPEMSGKCKSNPTKTNNMIYIIIRIYPPPTESLFTPLFADFFWAIGVQKNYKFSKKILKKHHTGVLHQAPQITFFTHLVHTNKQIYK